jgi:SAM-dependent methyltransferase
MSERSPDPDSLLYSDHWEPVLAAPALRVLERLGPEPATFLDLGAGTGSLTLAAAERWPEASIIALDASAGMLSVARHRVDVSGLEDRRFRWLPADAADIPLDDASVDAIGSSFMLQLVQDRAAVLLEVRRVLRPGGTFAFVTWLADELVLPADEAYEDALLASGQAASDDEDPHPPRAGDFHGLDEARDELAAAGFDEVHVEIDELRYRWSAASYLEFKQLYDDSERFEGFDSVERTRVLAAVATRLASLPADAFEISGQLVAAVARRPSG